MFKFIDDYCSEEGEEEKEAEKYNLRQGECESQIPLIEEELKEHIPLFIINYCSWIAMQDLEKVCQMINLERRGNLKGLFGMPIRITPLGYVTLVRTFGSTVYNQQDIYEFLERREEVAEEFTKIYITYCQETYGGKLINAHKETVYTDYENILMSMCASYSYFATKCLKNKERRLTEESIDACLRFRKENKNMNILHRCTQLL